MNLGYFMGYQDSNGFVFQLGSPVDDMIYPVRISQGITDYKPSMPFVPPAGESVIYLDNSSSDFPWTDDNIETARYSGGGIGSFYTFVVSTSTASSDLADTDKIISIFTGRVSELNPIPGLFDERITEMVISDFFYDLAFYPVNGLSAQINQTSSDLLATIYNTMMPYQPAATSINANANVFPVAWFDVRNGQTRGITAISKAVMSDFGHLYMHPGNLTLQPLEYVTRDGWIDQGKDLATFNNQWLDLEIGKSRDLEFAPIYVTYHPTSIADTDVVLFEFTNFPILKPGGTWTRICNYRDPNSKASFVTLADTDLTAPVSGTDYVPTGVPSSDLSVSLTNLGSAGKYSITNNGTANASFTTLQIRGKPVYSYDAVTVASTDGTPAASVLNVNLPYVSDGDDAEAVLNFLSIAYGHYPTASVVKSITWKATADSDAFEIARTARFGDIVHIIEDVNFIDHDYRITGWEWNLHGCNDIDVTFFVHPNDYMVLHMTDSDASIMTDSNGARFAFWR